MYENNPNITALIVEDEPVSLKLITSILSKNGYEVLAAETGKEAVYHIESDKHIDIIITDIMMPVMDGFQLIQYLKADLRLSKIPVIVCTSLKDMGSVTKAISIGAIDYISKPVNSRLLLEKMKKVEAKVPSAVLIVDDEDLLRNLLCQIFARDGNKVLVAKSGSEALEILAQYKVSLVISDIVMPEMDGMELLVEVKINYPCMPVILITGHSKHCSKEDATAAGADGYISKPFKNAEILMQTRQFL